MDVSVLQPPVFADNQKARCVPRNGGAQRDQCLGQGKVEPGNIHGPRTIVRTDLSTSGRVGIIRGLQFRKKWALMFAIGIQGGLIALTQKGSFGPLAPLK